MEFASHMNDINNLSSLLAESRQAQESASSQFNQKPSVTGSVNVITGASKTKDSNVDQNRRKEGSEKDIWAPEEILFEDQIIDWKDERPAPRYEFSYKQSVGTEDTFLGMSDKTPLTSDCTHLVVKIHFPGATMKDLDVNVTKKRIKAASKRHHLFTYLPVDVDADNGSAKFDTAKEVLTITLPIVAEY